MEIVELRVHGVHGTSPGTLLGVPDDQVGQVAGDRLTGVFRPRPGVELPYRQLGDSPVSVEAYSWGALTSGIQGLFGWVKRALWLLLLPFALANLAYWARLHLAEDTPTARWGARAARVGALLLTMFMVLTPCLLAIDLVAWQCYRGDSPGCPSLPGVLNFLARMDSAQRLAVGSVVPLAVIALLWFLSRQSLIRYEEVIAVDEAARDVPAWAIGNEHVDVLRHPKLWQGKDRTLQLQRIHLSVALGVVVTFTGIHVLALPQHNPFLVAVTTIGAIGCMVAAFSWVCVIHPDDIDYFLDSTSRITAWRRQHLPEAVRRYVRSQLPEWLLRIAAALTVVHLFALMTLPTPLDDRGDFLGRNLWFIGVFVLLTAVHLSIFLGGRMSTGPALGVVLVVFLLALYALYAHWDNLENSDDPRLEGFLGNTVLIGFGSVLVLWVALTVWHVRQGRRYPGAAWNGAGASFMLAAAAWVGLLFTTAIVTATADYLNGDDHHVDDLVTQTENIAQTLAPNRAPADSEVRRELTATADITAKDAVILRDPTGGLVVASGKLSTKALFERTAQDDPELAGLLLSLDSTQVRRAVVRLPNPWIYIEDVCIRTPGAEPAHCSAEDDDFIASGVLPIADGQVAVDAGGGAAVTIQVNEPPQMPLAVPQVLIWSPLMQFVWILLVGVFVAGAVTVFGKPGAAIEAMVAADPELADRDRSAVGHARKRAAFAHRAERLLDGIGAITAIVAISVIVFSATGEPPWVKMPWTRNIATLSMYVVLALALGLVYLASRLRSSDQTRKAVGVLWDLTTFWPRAAHPLAPPCYAERVVPELRTRVNWVLEGAPSADVSGRPDLPDRSENLVILSGHSQGSAIVAALVSRLSRNDLKRIRVITYGSQIRALYGRVFPRVLGPDAIGYVPTTGMDLLRDPFPDAPSPRHPSPPPFLAPPADPDLTPEQWQGLPLFARVFAAGGEWASLFRRTDPLGFRVFSDADAPPDHPVPEVPPASAGDPGPLVQGHSGYQHSRVYRAKVAEWTGEPLVEEPSGTRDVPFLPVI